MARRELPRAGDTGRCRYILGLVECMHIGLDTYLRTIFAGYVDMEEDVMLWC